MAKKLQLQIPIPCHENWENMTPGDKGRFCSSCQKKVIDFSNMSDREIALFFKKSSTRSVCGRFIEEQLNRDIEIPRKRIPWFKYFLQISLPAFVISMKASSQREKSKEAFVKESCTRVVGDTAWVIQHNIDPILTNGRIHLNKSQPATEAKIQPSPKAKIRGKVVDKDGNAVPFASVLIKGAQTGVMADSNGVFLIAINQLDDVSLVVSCVGFAPSETNLSKMDSGSEIIVALKQNNTLGEVIVTSPTERKTQASLSAVTTSRSYADTSKNNSFSNFKIYPNPLPSNSTLHIVWNQKEIGDHVLELFNQAGQRVFSQEIYIDQEAKLLEVTLPSLSAGNYFLRLTGKSTGRSHSQKLVVN
jgi:hypothetical protein